MFWALNRLQVSVQGLLRLVPTPFAGAAWYGLILIAVALVILADAADADDSSPSSVNKSAKTCEPNCVAVGEWSFAVGLGFGERSNPVIGHDDVPIYVVPEVSYYGEKFFLENLDFGYTLYNTDRAQFNLLLTPGFEHTFFSDSLYNRINVDQVDPSPPPSPPKQPTPNGVEGDQSQELNISKRRMAGMFGFEYVYFLKFLEVQLQALDDVSGVHHGEKVRAAISLPLYKNRHQVLLTAGLTYQSSKLLDYYYGLRADDVSYEVNDGFMRSVRADWRYKISKSWTLRAIVSYKQLASSVESSPLVKDDYSVTYFVGGIYHF